MRLGLWILRAAAIVFISVVLIKTLRSPKKVLSPDSSARQISQINSQQVSPEILVGAFSKAVHDGDLATIKQLTHPQVLKTLGDGSRWDDWMATLAVQLPTDGVVITSVTYPSEDLAQVRLQLNPLGPGGTYTSTGKSDEGIVNVLKDKGAWYWYER